MRVIAGKYGGRKLSAFKADHLRPTTDRVKETIFNKLQFIIDGACVLDLFSGTGNLSIEALSRGAQSVVAVDISSKSMSILNKNKNLLGIGEELKPVQMDIFKFLSTSQSPFDIILVDPPFTKKMGDQVLRALCQSSCFTKQSEVFIETSNQETVSQSYGTMIEKSKKSYGDKFLSHYVFG